MKLAFHLFLLFRLYVNKIVLYCVLMLLNKGDQVINKRIGYLGVQAAEYLKSVNLSAYKVAIIFRLTIGFNGEELGLVKEKNFAADSQMFKEHEAEAV